MVLALLLLASGGCSLSPSRDEAEQRARDERTREEVARATERAKPAIQEAGRKLGEAAKTAAEQAHAAAQGVEEGWRRGGHRLVDLNYATEQELASIPGISKHDARRIIAARPYHDKHELVAKGIVSDQTYGKIRGEVTVKRP
jgi:DNA uptake protein ComE-like DNA-binding protein